MMRKITIKAFSACEAVEFFSIVNPFMFHDEMLSRFREHPEWCFMDAKTGEPIEAEVKIPDNCDLVWDNEQRELRFDAPDASLVLEYAIVDGVRIPAEQDACCNCPIDTNE